MIFADRVARLERRLKEIPSLLVALSGGVDSAALLGSAAGAVSGRVVAATTVSAAVPEEEVRLAGEVARRFGVEHFVVETDELSDARYRANRSDRCYFCRVFMYDRLHELSEAEGLAALADGLQADDDVADRAGVRAARERGVLHPMREAGLGKADARRLARGFGLDLHDKPAQPCLASRLPVGIEVTAERLGLVHAAEHALREQGFRVLRVRCEGEHARIVLGAAELARGRAMERELVETVVAAGFSTAGLDDRPYGG